MLWDAWTDAHSLGTVLFGVLIAWPLTALALHGASWLAGGEGSFRRTLAVAG